MANLIIGLCLALAACGVLFALWRLARDAGGKEK